MAHFYLHTTAAEYKRQLIRGGLNGTAEALQVSMVAHLVCNNIFLDDSYWKGAQQFLSVRNEWWWSTRKKRLQVVDQVEASLDGSKTIVVSNSRTAISTVRVLRLLLVWARGFSENTPTTDHVNEVIRRSFIVILNLDGISADADKNSREL